MEFDAGGSDDQRQAKGGRLMPTGRKPVPTEERRRRGEKPIAPPVVVGGRGSPDMPPGLSERSKSAWRQIVRDLASAGILDRADAFVIEALAVHVGRARDARAIIAKEGLLSKTAHGGAHAAVGIEERALREVRQLCDQLPLSPWGRARLGLTLARGGGEGADDEMEREIGLAPRLRVLGKGNG
jgi:P27 family predicted phage terminase small subunit